MSFWVQLNNNNFSANPTGELRDVGWQIDFRCLAPKLIYLLVSISLPEIKCYVESTVS